MSGMSNYIYASSKHTLCHQFEACFLLLDAECIVLFLGLPLINELLVN